MKNYLNMSKQVYKKLLNQKYIISVFCIIFIFCTTIFFTGCANRFEQLVKQNMSDMRINFFEGENDLLYADLSCGYREQNFAYDGISTQKVECGVLSVEFKKVYSYQSICISLEIDGNTKDYVLERSPFENKYMVDLEKIINNNSLISFALKNQAEKCNLACVSKNWKVQYDNAIKIAVDVLKDDLSKLFYNNKLNAEGYLKVVSKHDYDQKFWYFSYIDKTGQSKSMLINVTNGKIIKN